MSRDYLYIACLVFHVFGGETSKTGVIKMFSAAKSRLEVQCNTNKLGGRGGTLRPVNLGLFT